MSLGAGRSRPHWNAHASGHPRPRVWGHARRSGPPASAGLLRVRPVSPADERLLAELFPRLDSRWFRPHDLGTEGARQVTTHAGKDVYLVGFLHGEPVAYGMLRGWDEGYRIPALGIAVRAGYRGCGLGRQMMHALHDAVRQRGGHRVRLRVAPDNARARRLYGSMGYRQVGIERDELVLLLDLDAAGAAPPPA